MQDHQSLPSGSEQSALLIEGSYPTETCASQQTLTPGASRFNRVKVCDPFRSLAMWALIACQTSWSTSQSARDSASTSSALVSHLCGFSKAHSLISLPFTLIYSVLITISALISLPLQRTATVGPKKSVTVIIVLVQ